MSNLIPSAPGPVTNTEPLERPAVENFSWERCSKVHPAANWFLQVRVSSALIRLPPSFQPSLDPQVSFLLSCSSSFSCSSSCSSLKSTLNQESCSSGICIETLRSPRSPSQSRDLEQWVRRWKQEKETGFQSDSVNCSQQ